MIELLTALLTVILLGRLLGWIFARVGQPAVIGEVVAGVALGPSCLGWLLPQVSVFLFPPTVIPSLGAVAQIGVVLYMFLIGLELNPETLRGRVRTALAISQGSIVIPLVLGGTLGFYLYPGFSTPGTSVASFVLFFAVAMSVTAFPVLARILVDRGMQTTPLGTLALACAAVADVSAWCLLAFVIAGGQRDGADPLAVSAMTAAFIAVMFLVIRPSVVALVARGKDREPGQAAIAAALIAMLIAALITEAIGVHAIFGAFLMGAVMPHDSRLVQALERSINHLVAVLLLPAFFALAGMRTDVGLLEGWSSWVTLALIVAVATVGKFGGTMLTAHASGLSWRDAAGLGALMNTRGLMELIVLNVGLDLGVISPALFTMMVLMALLTTVATGPVLQALFGSATDAPPPGAAASL
jgi:Kef-type K+ transport system membrane component KefB